MTFREARTVKMSMEQAEKEANEGTDAKEKAILKVMSKAECLKVCEELIHPLSINSNTLCFTGETSSQRVQATALFLDGKTYSQTFTNQDVEALSLEVRFLRRHGECHFEISYGSSKTMCSLRIQFSRVDGILFYPSWESQSQPEADRNEAATPTWSLDSIPNNLADQDYDPRLAFMNLLLVYQVPLTRGYQKLLKARWPIWNLGKRKSTYKNWRAILQMHPDFLKKVKDSSNRGEPLWNKLQQMNQQTPRPKINQSLHTPFTLPVAQTTQNEKALQRYSVSTIEQSPVVSPKHKRSRRASGADDELL